MRPRSSSLARSPIGLLLSAATAGACGGAGPAVGPADASPRPVDGAASVSAAAPAWAKEGDAEVGDGYRFICEGEADSEEAALGAAVSLCDDKICKLCGVEVESVVSTKETLTGVEMSRQVVERCRRVRRGAPNVERKLTDCYQGRCTSWVQLAYPKRERDAECKRYSDDDFADPAACQARIEELRNLGGYSAASFRERVRLVDAAIVACADIDVRPTPLMGSLGEKLKVAMAAWRTRDTPSWLLRSYLADHPPMWQQYEEDPSFVSRLRLLRGYLAHKVLVMDVVEASLRNVAELDTEAGLGHLMDTLRALGKEPQYGVEHVHFLAVSEVRDAWEKKQMRLSAEPVAAFIRGMYGAGEVTAWDERIDLVQLFCADDRISAAEWDYIASDDAWRSRSFFELLDVEDHGSPQTRLSRFDQAVTLALGGLEGQKVSRRFHAVSQVIPNDGDFLLQVEKRLPQDLRAGYDWEFLLDRYRRVEDEVTAAERGALLLRLRRTLDAPAAEPAELRNTCIALADRLALLETWGQDTNAADRLVCECLVGALGDEGLSLSSKSDLYARALRRGLPCVSPRS